MPILWCFYCPDTSRLPLQIHTGPGDTVQVFEPSTPLDSSGTLIKTEQDLTPQILNSQTTLEQVRDIHTHLGFITGLAAQDPKAWNPINLTSRVRKVLYSYSNGKLQTDPNYILIPVRLMDFYQTETEVDYIYANPQAPQYGWAVPPDEYIFKTIFNSMAPHRSQRNNIIQFYYRMCQEPPNVSVILILNCMLDSYINMFYKDRNEAKYIAQMISTVWQRHPEIRAQLKYPENNISGNFKFSNVDIHQPVVADLNSPQASKFDTSLQERQPKLYQFLIQRLPDISTAHHLSHQSTEVKLSQLFTSQAQNQDQNQDQAQGQNQNHKSLTLRQGLKLLQEQDKTLYRQLLDLYPTLKPINHNESTTTQTTDVQSTSKLPAFLDPWLEQHIPSHLKAENRLNQKNTASPASWGIVIYANRTKDKYRAELEACQETWFKEARDRGIPVYIFVGDEVELTAQTAQTAQTTKTTKTAENKAQGNVISLPWTGEDVQSATAKQYGGLEWMQTYRPCRYYYFIGTDNYVSIPALDKLIAELCSTDILVGGKIEQRRVVSNDINAPTYPFLSGGAGIIIGQGALNKIRSHGQDKYGNDRLRYLGEKIWGQIVTQPGAQAFLLPACDVSICYFASLQKIPLCTYTGFYGEQQHFKHIFRPDEQFYSFHRMTPDLIRFWHQTTRPVLEWYESIRNTPSNINQHMETLYHYASTCSTILECGVGTVQSSWPFVLSLAQGYSQKLVSCDLKCTPQSLRLIEVCRRQSLNFEFVVGNDLKLNLPQCDLLFIDTWHVYGQLKRELAKLAPQTRKYIIMHNTQVDGQRGEFLRCKGHMEAQTGTLGLELKKICRQSGFSKVDVTTGLQPAIDEFLSQNLEWSVEKIFTNNNGLTILKRTPT